MTSHYFDSCAFLNQGDILFIAYNADGDDGFAILALVDINPNSSIYFSDNEWNGGSIGNTGAFIDFNEGEMSWDSGSDTIKAGTVIIFNEIDNSSNSNYSVTHGSISGTMSLSASDEAIYAYLGTDAFSPTLFLAAISNESYSISGSIDSTGLDINANAIEFHGDEDVMIYQGSMICDSSLHSCVQNICNTSNWGTENGTGDQSSDGGIDFPESIPPSFTGTALALHNLNFSLIVNDQNVLIDILFSFQKSSILEIQKADETLRFNTIATYNLDSNRDTLFQTQFIDHHGKSGINYYRISIDKGKFYSEIQYSEIKDWDISTSIFPNPFNYNFHVNEGFNGSGYKIIDSKGRICDQGFIRVEKALGSNLERGEYFLHISRGLGSKVIRIFKK